MGNDTLISPEMAGRRTRRPHRLPSLSLETLLTMALLCWIGPAAVASAQQYRGTPPYQPTTLTEAVSKIAANDQRQDLRLYNLEKDVSHIQEAKNTHHNSYESGLSPLPTGAPYTVRKGDTLWRIAMTHRVSAGEIMTLNGMPTDQVIEGQSLLIPNRNAPPAPPMTPKTTAKPSSIAGTHLVGPGDTFSQIARQYRVSQDALAAANPGVNPDLIQIGSHLVIPGTAATSTPPPPPSPKATIKAGGGTYTVRPGDHLGSIAKAHGVPTASLQQVNGLTNPNVLRIGQVLVLPAGATPPSSNPSTQSYASSPSNYTPPSTPPPTYPAPASPTPAPPPPSASTPPPAPQTAHRGILSYRVDSTDSLESIANTFGTTPQRIRELNMLSPTQNVVTGQELLVPSMGAVGAR